MLSRRDLLSSAVVGRAAAPEAGQSSDRSNQEIVQALKDLRSAITAPQGFPEIARVRTGTGAVLLARRHGYEDANSVHARAPLQVVTW